MIHPQILVFIVERFVDQNNPAVKSYLLADFGKPRFTEQHQYFFYVRNVRFWAKNGELFYRDNSSATWISIGTFGDPQNRLPPTKIDDKGFQISLTIPAVTTQVYYFLEVGADKKVYLWDINPLRVNWGTSIYTLSQSGKIITKKDHNVAIYGCTATKQPFPEVNTMEQERTFQIDALFATSTFRVPGVYDLKRILNTASDAIVDRNGRAVIAFAHKDHDAKNIYFGIILVSLQEPVPTLINVKSVPLKSPKAKTDWPANCDLSVFLIERGQQVTVVVFSSLYFRYTTGVVHGNDIELKSEWSTIPGLNKFTKDPKVNVAYQLSRTSDPSCFYACSIEAPPAKKERLMSSDTREKMAVFKLAFGI